MSKDPEKKKKEVTPSQAAQDKAPTLRVKELLKELKGDRKKIAYAMEKEGYGRPEIEVGFKEATGKGLGPTVWATWKKADDVAKQVGEEAAPILTIEEKRLMAEAAARFKNVNQISQMLMVDIGVWAFLSIAPLVAAETPELKLKGCKEFLKKAVAAYDPNQMKELEEFSAMAFVAAEILRGRVALLMHHLSVSYRLDEHIRTALLSSPEEYNPQVFNKLLAEYLSSLRVGPEVMKTTKEQVTAIAQAYAEARGVSFEQAEAILKELPLTEGLKV